VSASFAASAGHRGVGHERIIADLERDGHDSRFAKELLVIFQKTLRMHEEHRHNVVLELETVPPQFVQKFFSRLARSHFAHWRNKNERGSTMKTKKPFDGLTSGEHQQLTEIRMLAQVDLVTAKRAAADWVLSNKQRRVLRQAACRTIKCLPA
jgi:hypothetical protein